MKRKISLVLVFCLCLTLFGGINVQRVKADVSPFVVNIYGSQSHDIPCSELSSLSSLDDVIASAEAIATNYPTETINVIIKLNTDIDITPYSSDPIVIPDRSNVQWEIKSNDTLMKKITCGSRFFYIYKGNNINFDRIEMEYAGTSDAFILQSSTGSTDGGKIIITNCVINSTGMSDPSAAVRAAGSQLLIRDSIVSSSGIAIYDNNTNDMTILNSTISAIGKAIYAECPSDSNAQVNIDGTSISSDSTYPCVYLKQCKQSTIKDCTVYSPNGKGVSAFLAADKSITLDKCNITADKSALEVTSSSAKSGSVTIKNNCTLSCCGTANIVGTVCVNSASLTLEKSTISYSGSSYDSAVFLGSDADANISECDISSSYYAVRVDNHHDGTVSISGCNISANGTNGAAIKASMGSGKTSISDCTITKSGGGNAINVEHTGTLSLKGSTVTTTSSNGKAISTNSDQASNIVLNNSTLSARNGDTIDLGRSKLKTDGTVILSCGDDQSEVTDLTCIRVGLDGSNTAGSEDVRAGAIDVHSGSLALVPFNGGNPDSTSFAAIKVKGDTPVSISAIFTPTSECSFEESPDHPGVIYNGITGTSKNVAPEPSYSYSSYDDVKKETEVNISSKKDQKTVIVLDADGFKNLDLSKTDELLIILTPSNASGTLAGTGMELELKIDLSALPKNIKSLKVNTGTNLIVVDDISNKEGSILELKLVETNKKKLRNVASKKEAYNVIDIDCTLNGSVAEKVRIDTKVQHIIAFSVSDKIPYSGVPDTVKKPIWVSIAENGTITRLDSKIVTNSETGEHMIEAAVSGSGTYGVMDDTDLDEIIKELDIANAASTRFMIRTKAAENKHTIKWDPVTFATTYKVYGAKNNGSFKKLGEVDHFDFLTFTNKNTGEDVWKYKIVAYAGKEKLGTSVVIYGAYDKNATAVSKVTLAKTKKTLAVGKTYKLDPELTGTSPQAPVRYFSSNPMIAKVNKNGKITAVNSGKCEVFAYAANGYYKKIKITVK